jgi:hypothetical protein
LRAILRSCFYPSLKARVTAIIKFLQNHSIHGRELLRPRASGNAYNDFPAWTGSLAVVRGPRCSITH